MAERIETEIPSRFHAPTAWRVPFDSRSFIAALLVFASYFLGAKIGFALTFKPHPVSVLWPPNSILLAALLLMPRRAWWIVLLAALPAHWLVQLQSNVPPYMIFCWFVSNCCEALIGASCIRYFICRPIRFDRLRNVAIFCFFAAVLGPFLSSFLDSGFVALNHWGVGSYWEIWRIRFSSNVLAALTITPFIVTLAAQEIALWKNISRARWVEGGCLMLGLFVISFVLFNHISSEADSALLYMPLPFLLWAAVRFGSQGAATAIATVAFLAIWGVAHGHGPFSENSAEKNALYVQLFLIFLTVPLLLLAALIEERNKVEETLRESEERMNLAADAAKLGMWEWNLANDEVWVTKTRRDFVGLPASERVTLEAFISRLHADDRHRIRQTLNDAVRNGNSYDSEFRVVLPDGRIRWMAARGRVQLNEHGKPARMLGISIDITARKQAELEAKQRRDDLGHLSRVALMGEMSASLAHELNQPLSGIVSNAGAGQRFIDRGNVNMEEIRDLLADIGADARRAGEVIRGIRSMVKKGEPARKRINLNDVVQNVVHMISPDALLHSCELELSLDNSLPIVEADPIQVQQVLLNLIVNAFDAMRGVSALRRKIEISTHRNGSQTVRTSVRDYGTGFSQETNERLFDRFFTTKADGLGMGLAIVRSILESHAGSIKAENAEGGGARFDFMLPVNGPSLI